MQWLFRCSSGTNYIKNNVTASIPGNLILISKVQYFIFILDFTYVLENIIYNMYIIYLMSNTCITHTQRSINNLIIF